MIKTKEIQYNQLGALYATAEQREFVLPTLSTIDGLIDFIVINNPNGVRDFLLSQNLVPVDTSQDGLFDVVRSLYDAKNPLFDTLITEVPYNNEANNITGGLQKFFNEIGKILKKDYKDRDVKAVDLNSGQVIDENGEVWTPSFASTGWMSWVGAGLSAVGSFFGIMSGQNGGQNGNAPWGINPTTGVPFSSQAEATAYQQQQLQREQQKAKTRRILIWVAGGITVVTIGLIIAKSMRNKNK